MTNTTNTTTATPSTSTQRKRILSPDEFETALGYSSEEQETTICISRDSDEVSCWTSDSTMITKLKKIVNTEGNEWEVYEGPLNSEGKPTGYFFKGPKDLIVIRPKHVAMSEEKRAEVAERFAKARAKNAD